MFNKNKEKRQKMQFEVLKNRYKADTKIDDCNNELFLNYLLDEMRGRKVHVSYHFGIFSMKKELNGDQIIIEYPVIEIEEWAFSIEYSECCVRKKENETLLIIKHCWHSPTPDQKAIITY